ncbi:MAG: FixH family protein [Pseudomonadota bacterium]
MSNASTHSPRKFTGYHMIAIMVAFFGTIISVNLFMAYNATQSWTGLVVKNSYVASQNFNEVTAAKKAQQAMGWKAIPAYENGQFTIEAKAQDTSPLSEAIVTAMVGRPAFEDQDRIVHLTEADTGTYIGSTDLGTGVWHADVTITGPSGEIWTRKLRFTVK